MPKEFLTVWLGLFLWLARRLDLMEKLNMALENLYFFQDAVGKDYHQA